ncbi:hypothetical protein ACHAWF_018444 [Thalassiosira exigua]
MGGQDLGESCYYDSDCKSQVCECERSICYYGVCKACRLHSQCAAQVTQPPAGEWGDPFCVDNACVAHLHGESRIPEEGYLTWIPSETFDNSESFHEIAVPRRVLREPSPVFDQVWYIDLNDQEESFKKGDIRFNGTHIQLDIPSPSTSMTSTRLGFQHFLEDTSRGDYIKQKSDEALSEPWAHTSWLAKALTQVVNTGLVELIPSVVETAIDQAIAWQIRRYASSYQDDGSLNPTTSTAWAAHTEKAQQAVAHAKNPDFRREYPKSEQICYHMEEGNGVDASDTHIILPLGRPFTTLSGQTVNSPVYFLGFAVGYFTAHYDESKGVLQLYFQAHASSRQYTDVMFPGPYETALYVSPVAEGSDYVVDPNTDGRYDSKMQLTQPSDDPTAFLHDDEPYYSLWARPQSDTCAQDIESEAFWYRVDLGAEDDNIYDTLVGNYDILNGVIRGMPCAAEWMSSDYGPGTNEFGPNEYGVWAHFLFEVRDDKTREFALANFWNNWECFYGRKDPAACTEDMM